MSELSFLNVEFVPVELNRSRALEEFLLHYPQCLSGYTLATLAAWNSSYHYEWGIANSETLFVSCRLLPDSERYLLQPVGPVASEVQQRLIEGSAGLNYPLKILNVTSRFLKEYPKLLQAFTVSENRAFSNYFYRTDALAKLRGRKYSKKRNLLSQAAKLYSWTSKPLTAESTDDCFTVLDSIEKEESPVIEGMLEREISALKYTLTYFNELSQQGLLIYVDDMPVAFSIFEEISSTTVAVHFERALRRYKGLYQVVNQETARVIARQGYTFINREEDLGDPGLRDAKMSYHPTRIVPAYELIRM